MLMILLYLDECSDPEPLEDAKTVNVHENDLPKNGISKDDLLCSACKELLVRPVVLNCGHGIIILHVLLFFLSF